MYSIGSPFETLVNEYSISGIGIRPQELSNILGTHRNATGFNYSSSTPSLIDEGATPGGNLLDQLLLGNFSAVAD